MDLTRVYTKTSKGILEGNTKSREVTREHGRVLTLIDGKSSVATILEKSTRLSENRLAAILDELVELGMIRQLNAALAVDDFGFSSTIIVGESDTQAFFEAQVNHDRELRRAEALAAQDKDEGRTTLLNEVKADIQAEAESIKREYAKRSTPEAEDKAQAGFQRAAELQARREADLKARAEAKLHQARKDAEARAEALAEHARKQFAAESKRRQEAEARANTLQAEVFARNEAVRKAKQESAQRAQAEADAKARMEIEKKARVEAEKQALAAEKAREAAENKARKAAEQTARLAKEAEAKAHAQRVLEAKIQDEEDAQRRAETEARLRETEQGKRRAEEEARALAKAAEEARIATELENRVKRRVEARTREVEAAREQAEAEARAKQEEALRLAQEAEARQEAEGAAAAAKAEQEAQAKREAERQTQAIAEAQALVEVEAKRLAEETQKAQEAAEREEEARQQAAAEQHRIEAEKAAEDARLLAEKREEEERKAQEASIKAENEARQQAAAEQHRIEAEKAAESARLLAEKNAAAERKAQEARIKTEHEARRNAEAEKRRIEAEKARAAEEARRAAEKRADLTRKQREAAEREAQIAAEAREKAEVAAREQAEAEQRRIEAEKAKKAEAARLAAEQQAEEERLLAQANAQAVAEAEQAVRLEAEATKRQLAEQQRAEDERLQREKLALKEEQERAAAEAARVLAETHARAEIDAQTREEARQLARDRADKSARAEAAEALRHMKDTEQREEAEEERMRGEAQTRAMAAAQGAAAFPFLTSRKRTRARLGKNLIKPLFYSLLGLLVLAVVMLHLVPLNFYIPKLEQQLAESLGQRVVVRDLHFSIYPAPHLLLEGVTIGDLADVRIGRARVFPTFSAWYSDDKVIPRVELESVALSDDSVRALSIWSQHQAQTAAIQFEKIRVKDAKLQNRLLDLFTFDADVLMRQGRMAKAQIISTDKRIMIDITPQKEGLAIQLAATGSVLPFEPRLKFDGLKIAAITVPGGMTLNQIDGQLYGGSVSGNAQIDWHDGWVFKSDLGIRQIAIEPALAMFTRNITVTGALEAKIRLSAKSVTLETLFDAPQVQATFRARDGEVASIDLVRAIQSARSNGNIGGKTHFNELSGYFQLANGRYQYRQLKLTTGMMSASGNVDLSIQQNLSGNLLGELRTRNTVLRMPFILGGTLPTPSLKIAGPAARPPAPAAVVSEPEQ